LVVFLFTGAGNTLNDYLDREIDKISHSNRPIPRGRVRSRNALIFSGVLFAASVGASLRLNPYCILIVLVNLAIMLTYEFKAKGLGLSGNLMISWLTASLFLFGGMAVYNDYPEILNLVLIILVLSFFATLGREISKDIQDIRGDIGRRRTLPIRIGRKKAGYVAIVCFMLAVVFSPLPYYLKMFGWLYLVIVLVADAIFIYAGASLKRSPKRASNNAKLAMFVALVAFLLGGLI
jgi:geranylgeranylglycerol-phosphate geranylgeranyltransferase